MGNVRGIELAENEFTIREYEASNLTLLNKSLAKGYAIITNERFIFTSSAKTTLGNSVLVREAKMNEITGIQAGLSNKKSIAQLIVGALIAVFGLMMLFGFPPVGIILLIIAAIVIYNGLKSKGIQMRLSVLCHASTSPISISGEGSRGLFARMTSGNITSSLSGSPAMHTEQFIREIGALIQDVQQLGGERAAEKWRTIPLSAAPTPVVEPAPVYQPATPTPAPAVSAVSLKKPTATMCTCGNVLDDTALFCNECGKKI